nr:transposase, MuDR, MULE transposase domain protein [Tanacetum cinerariifolium]
MSTSSNTTFEFDVNHKGEFKLNPLTYQHGSLLNIHVLQMDFEDIVSYLKWKIPRQFTTLYYMLPPNYALSGMKQIKNDYETNVMYDIAKVAGKLQNFVSHILINLSTVLIPNNGSLKESLAAMKEKHYGIQQVRGSPYEAFEMLPYYCYNLEQKNEGTVTRIKTDNKGVFEMLFIVIGASIRTFLNYIRLVLMIDAAHLKGLYKGTNLVVVAMDGNKQIVPIAFGICKGNRHPAIAMAVENEFPLAFHV